MWSKKNWSKDFGKWLFTSVDTDEWMIILLAMSTGKKLAHGPEAVQVTMQRIVGGVPRCLLVNRAFVKIVELDEATIRRGPPLTSRVGDPMRTTRSARSSWSTS